MTDIAIRVENLSKRYRIGLKEEMHDTLFGAMADFVRQPIKNLRRLRQLSRFEEDGHDSEDIIWALKDVSFEVKRGEVVGIPSTSSGQAARQRSCWRASTEISRTLRARLAAADQFRKGCRCVAQLVAWCQANREWAKDVATW